VVKSQTPSGRSAAAVLRDYARDDLFFQVETMQENDLPGTSFQFCMNVVKQKHPKSMTKSLQKTPFNVVNSSISWLRRAYL